MGNSNQVKTVVLGLNKKYPGERTTAMLQEWIALMSNFPIRTVKGIEKRIIHKFNYWPTIDQMLEISDKVTEDIKIQDSQKRDDDNKNIFDLEKLSNNSGDFKGIAGVYTGLWKKHGQDFEAMAHEMIKLESKYPGMELKQCGENMLRHRENGRKKIIENEENRKRKAVLNYHRQMV